MLLRNKKKHSQKGIALITVMLMLAVMSILAVTMFNTSSVESLISHNYRTSKEAFYDADAGVQYSLAAVNSDLANFDIDDIDPADYSAPSGYSFTLSSFDARSQDSDPYCFTSFGQGPNNAGAEIQACFHVESNPHSAFDFGILSDGDITFNGNSDILGDVHANGDVSMSSGGNNITGEISASGTADVGGTVVGGVTSNAAVVDVPRVRGDDSDINDPAWTQDDIDQAESAGKTVVGPVNGFSSPNQHNTIQDSLILVYGDVTITNNTTLKNVTIISTGDVTFRGRANQDDGANKNAIIARGDITFRGASDSYAVFWCNGTFTMNGASSVVGSIVSSGANITRNGSNNFSFDENIENNHLATELSVTFANWRDMSLN